MSIKFSILIPVYNRAKFLPQLFENIRAINYNNYEVVMVDDASTDNSLAIMKNEQQKFTKLKVFANSTNKKVAAARNEGLKHCQGEYICLLDCDDFLDGSALQKANDFLLQNPQIDVLVFDELKFNQQRQRLYLKFTQDYYLRKQALFRTAFGGAGTVIRTSVLRGVGGYDERLPISEDRALSYKLLSQVKMAGIAQRLYYYREHSTNLTKTADHFKKTIQYQRIINQYQNFSVQDYINDWQQVKNFLTLQFDYPDVRRQRYANVILKCSLKLAELGERKLALAELQKAQFLHPRPRYFIFKLLIFLGKKNFQKIYQNLNALTNYYYDDFLYLDLTEREKTALL